MISRHEIKDNRRLPCDKYDEIYTNQKTTNQRNRKEVHASDIIGIIKNQHDIINAYSVGLLKT